MATASITTLKAGRMSGEDRRNQIVQVAMELFARKGFDGTTTKEIAEAANVSEAIIFRHFARKSDLYSAIIDTKIRSKMARFNQALEDAIASKDDRRLFESLAFEILEYHKRDQTHMRLVLYSALEGHELARLLSKCYVNQVHERLWLYFKERISARAFRRIDPKAAVRAFIGMLICQAINQYLIKDPVLKMSNRRAAEVFTDIFLNGIKKTTRKR